MIQVAPQRALLNQKHDCNSLVGGRFGGANRLIIEKLFHRKSIAETFSGHRFL